MSFLLLDLHFLSHQTDHNLTHEKRKKKNLFFGNDNSHRSFKSTDLHFRKIITITTKKNWPSDLYKAWRFEEMWDVRSGRNVDWRCEPGGFIVRLCGKMWLRSLLANHKALRERERSKLWVMAFRFRPIHYIKRKAEIFDR